MKDNFKNYFYTQLSKERNHIDTLKRARRKKARAADFDKSTPTIKAGQQRTIQAFNFDPESNDSAAGGSYGVKG